MLKRRYRSKNSTSLLQTFSRGSDILRPDNTSLIVNESDTETDELPREITSVLSEGEMVGQINRGSTSLMNSLTQKTQSTPRRSLKSAGTKFKKVEIPENPTGKVKNFCSLKTVTEGDCVKENSSYFEQIIKESGACPLPGSSSYLMSEDQALFTIKINNKLIEKDGNIGEFLNSFKKEIQQSEKLQKMLVHTLTANNCDVARGPIQDSLIRMLLHVECLQEHLIEILLQQLADVVLDQDGHESTHLVSLILRQMRFIIPVNKLCMSEKLFEIIHVAPLHVQREIIFMLPEIILSQDEVEKVCMQLLDLLRDKTALTNVIVDTITNLNLSKPMKAEVRLRVLSRMDKCPTEFLPPLVQFIVSKCDEEELEQVINGLRVNLPFSVKHLHMKGKEKAAEEDSYIKLTFEYLKFSVMASKQMTDQWMKIISGVSSPSDFRCFDLMVLIIIYSSIHGRKNNVLSVVRNKIKSHILTETQLEDMFNVLSVVAAEYFSGLLELASVLLKSNLEIVTTFGASLYKQCFIHFQFYMKQSVVNEILLHIGTGSSMTVNTALSAIRNLCDSHREALSQYTVPHMGLLTKISDLDISQFRLLVGIISDLIFFKSEDGNNGWQDELQIFIRKHLASTKLDICKKAIAGTIALAQNAANHGLDLSSNPIQVNTLLEIAMGTPDSCEAKRGFFNDELSKMIEASILNQIFLSYWSNKIQKVVTTNLFARNIDVECQHFPMSLQYSIDVAGDRQVVFPVVDLMTSSNSKKPLNVSVGVIPSTLRLLSCCEKDLNEILPFFCASVIMPEVTVFDNFHSYDEDKKKLIMDCLFLCFNYLIECINAFCTHGSADKALIRLKHLMSVRSLIGRYVHFMRDYTPPNCHFHCAVRKVPKKRVEKLPRKGKKRKVDGSCDDTSNHSCVETETPGTAMPSGEEAPPVVKPEHELARADLILDYETYFRHLNVSCYKLLKTDLQNNWNRLSESVRGMVENNWVSQSEQKLQLQTEDALFLLRDFVGKCEFVFEKSRKFNFSSTSNLYSSVTIKPETLIAEMVEILPAIMKKIECWSHYCSKLLKANEGVYDGPGMFSSDSQTVKLALTAALKFVAEIMSWQGFQYPANKPLHANVLSILCKRNERVPLECTSNEESMTNLASEAATCLSKLSKSVFVLSGALSLVKAVQACLASCPSAESHAIVARLSHELLCRPWYTVQGVAERGSTYNQHITYLIKIYFSTVEQKLHTVKSMAAIALDEIKNFSDKTSTMTTFKTIHRNNFPLFYRALCEALVSASAPELEKFNDDQLLLNLWNVIVDAMLLLVNIVKIHSSRINLAALLKSSQSIINLFFNRGMPPIESLLRTHSTEALKLLKSLQVVTRFLHSVCCHSKINNDSLVAMHVPAIRAQCERLTLEVKGALIMNNIPMECITIAILKNKDLQGNDIVSQETDDSFYSEPDIVDSGTTEMDKEF